jgi:hypothetical protein
LSGLLGRVDKQLSWRLENLHLSLARSLRAWRDNEPEAPKDHDSPERSYARPGQDSVRGSTWHARHACSNGLHKAALSQSLPAQPYVRQLFSIRLPGTAILQGILALHFAATGKVWPDVQPRRTPLIPLNTALPLTSRAQYSSCSDASPSMRQMLAILQRRLFARAQMASETGYMLRYCARYQMLVRFCCPSAWGLHRPSYTSSYCLTMTRR